MFINKKIQGGRSQFVDEKALITQEGQGSLPDFTLTMTGEQNYK